MRLSLHCRQERVGPHKLDPVLRNIFVVYFCLGNTRLVNIVCHFLISYFCVSVLFVFFIIFLFLYIVGFFCSLSIYYIGSVSPPSFRNIE